MTHTLFGIAIAIALLAIPNTDPITANIVGETIRVVSVSHRVDFPNEVVFELEVESGSTISEIILFYRLARQPVQVYGYPDFIPSTRVSMDFRVQTGGANYIPVGVDIEYHYRIVDSEGNSFETPMYHLEYLDPRFRWERLREGQLLVLWHGIPESRVRQVAIEVEGRIVEIANVLGLDSVPRMKAVVVSGHLEAARSFPVISRTASENHIYGGFAFNRFDLFMIAGLRADGMVHEATHLLIEEVAGSPLAKVPAWLNEGLAMYFEVETQAQDAIMVRAVRDDALINMTSMGTVPGRPTDVAIFYAQSYSIVKHLIDVYGSELVSSLLNSLDEGLSIDVALQSSHGFGLREFERNWKDDLVGETIFVRQPALEILGTSVLIAAAVAAASFAAYLISRRY